MMVFLAEKIFTYLFHRAESFLRTQPFLSW